MDTTQHFGSTMTGFLQSDEREPSSQNETERPKQRPCHAPPPEYQEKLQLYPQPLSPLGYYPYPSYPSLLSPIPTMSYLYMDFLRRLSLESELHSYLPKCEGFSNENSSKDCDRKTNNVRLKHTVQNNDCNLFHYKDRAYSEYSHMCLSCKQSLKCSCCNKPLTTERACSLVNKPSCNCCQRLISPHSYIQHCPVGRYDCACETQKKIMKKRKPKQKSDNKRNQTCPQTDQNNIPERENTPSQISNKKSIVKKVYHKNKSCKASSSDENFSQTENRREVYESDYESEDDKIFGFYSGEGDKHKTNKPKVKKTEKRARQSLSYFINV